jgi:phage antirepressor YoqD-like protein
MTNTNTIALLKNEQNGVEFYTVASTGESGMSQSGLAILAGVHRTTLVKLEDILVNSAPSESLEPFVGKVLTLVTNNAEINGNQAGNLKIYFSSYCAAVLQHYASKGNQTALFSLLKFAQQGIDKWIHEITGYSNKPAQPALPQDYLSALKALVESEEQKQLLAAENKEQKKALKEAAPKLQTYETVMASEEWYSFQEVATMIACPNLGRTKLMNFLRMESILTQHNLPYQQYVGKGYFKTIMHEIRTSYGWKDTETTRVSKKGIAFIIKKLTEAGYPVPYQAA